MSPRRQHRHPGATRDSPTRRIDRPPAAPDAARRKNLSKSVTEFFCKLRPSQRPERGNTIRPPPDSDEEHLESAAEPTSPRPTTSRQTGRSSSLGRYGPDTIPASRWNTPITPPPRRAHSVGTRAGRLTTRSLFPPNSNSPRRRPIPAPGEDILQARPQPHHLPHPTTIQTHPNPNPTSTPTHAYTPTPTPTPTPPTPTPTPAPTPLSTRNLFLAKRALRRQRHTLISSGDFLGVTGVNPYTGEPDLITPPTSSDDAIVTSSSSPTTATAAGSSALAVVGGDRLGISGTWVGGTGVGVERGGGLRWVMGGGGGGGGGGDERVRLGREREREERVGRRMQREAERLSRAEQRKDALRVMMQGSVKWRPEPGGWSSVAEPKLSPILQSPQGSGKSSVQGEGVGVSPQRQQQPFLGMAAVARGVNSCRRRRCGNLEGETRMILAGWRRPGETILGVVGNVGKGLCPSKKVMLRFCLPPFDFRQESPRSLLRDTGYPMEYPPEWELGNLKVIPMDLHRLSDDRRGQRTPAGRVLELDGLNMAEPWASSQTCDLNSLRSQTKMMLKVQRDRGLGPEFQSACTRTITTTGFGRSRPPHRAVGHPFDGMLDGSHEAPPSRQVPMMPKALLRSTSPLSSTGMPKAACSNQLASPGKMQLSVWLSPNSPGPQTAITMSVQKMVGIGLQKRRSIPHPLHKPGADSDITSRSTGQGKTAPGPGGKHSSKPGQTAAKTENQPPQQTQLDWAMRKTMRRPSGNASPQDETDTHKSSRMSTRTSTSLTTTTQSPSSGTAATTWQQNQAATETIARGAARTAFAHHRGGSGWVVRTRVPVSAPDPRGSQPPHWARVQAAGARAKAAAKPGAGAETGSGQGQGNGKGKGKSQDQGKEEKNGKATGKDKDKEKDKEKKKDKDKEKGKADTADLGNIEVKRWARNATLMLAKVVRAYWQVVSPVFDGDSQLRKRIDKAQATRGDLVVCVLALVFVFMAVSGGIWVVRGIVWFVKWLGKLGGVLAVMAGLQD